MSVDDRPGWPFWLHQIAEYLIAGVLIAGAWYSPEPVVQAVLGGLIIANAALADGPVGAFAVIGRTLHRWIDVGIMILLLVAAFQGWIGVGTTGRIALPLMSAALLVLWLNTDFAGDRR